MLFTLLMIALGLSSVVLIYLVYSALMSPELRYHSCRYKLKAKLFFWLGDIRRLNSFPWVTWATHDHKIDFKDARHGSQVSRAGDVGLHRDEGYLSNLGIPGAFKHAWITVDNNDCVEAVSEGVVRRDELYPLISDYAILLRPIGINKEEINTAVSRANSLVGCEYDANFNFDFEKADEDMPKFTKNLNSGDFHHAFSCTETAAFAWYHCKKKLGIFRSTYAGREAIAADDFLKMNYGIIWMSPSVTVEWAAKMGMHEEGRQKIKDFLEGKRDFNDHGNPIPRRK